MSQNLSLPPNPYSVLGVSRNAGPSEIRKAYHKLIADNAKKLCETQGAYELLTDEVRLAEYKRQAQSKPKSQTGAPRSGASQRSASTYETASGTNGSGYQPSARYQPPAGRQPAGYQPPEWRMSFPLRTYYERCEVCGETDCREVHRWFTREGFVWEQLKTLHLTEPNTDAIVAARSRAGKEFGDPDFSSINGMARPRERSRDSRNINEGGYDRRSYGTGYEDGGRTMYSGLGSEYL